MIKTFRFLHDEKKFEPEIWRNILLRKQNKDVRGLTIIDRTYDIPFEMERTILWLKQYIDYSRADLMAMDVIKFYRLVRVAEKKQQDKIKENNRQRAKKP